MIWNGYHWIPCDFHVQVIFSLAKKHIKIYNLISLVKRDLDLQYDCKIAVSESGFYNMNCKSCLLWLLMRSVILPSFYDRWCVGIQYEWTILLNFFLRNKNISIKSSDAGDRIFWILGSIPCLLMPWFVKSPEHQQAWNWLCRTDMYCCSRVDLIYLGQAKSKIWFKTLIYYLWPLKQLCMLKS